MILFHWRHSVGLILYRIRLQINSFIHLLRKRFSFRMATAFTMRRIDYSKVRSIFLGDVSRIFLAKDVWIVIFIKSCKDYTHSSEKADSILYEISLNLDPKNNEKSRDIKEAKQSGGFSETVFGKDGINKTERQRNILQRYAELFGRNDEHFADKRKRSGQWSHKNVVQGNIDSRQQCDVHEKGLLIFLYLFWRDFETIYSKV